MNNSLELCGVVRSAPEPSHENHGIAFCSFRLAVKRLSGAEDVVNVLTEQKLAEEAGLCPGQAIRIQGELRSYNDKNAEANRLKIHAWAKTVEPCDGEHVNIVRVTGLLCKAPIFRQTPYGREIADMILSIPRRPGPKTAVQRCDYLPCIAWGSMAHLCAGLHARSILRIEGRLQSRKYIKVIDGESFERTAYEVSVSTAEILEAME